MGKHTRKPPGADEPGRSTLGELIHAAVRRAIEAAVDEELPGALGADRYEREAARRGYRNGTKERTLTGPTGPVPLTLPRATLTTPAGHKEWTSTLEVSTDPEALPSGISGERGVLRRVADERGYRAYYRRASRPTGSGTGVKGIPTRRQLVPLVVSLTA